MARCSTSEELFTNTDHCLSVNASKGKDREICRKDKKCGCRNICLV